MAALPELALTAPERRTARHVSEGAVDRVSRPQLQRLADVLGIRYSTKDGTQRLFGAVGKALGARRWAAAPEAKRGESDADEEDETAATKRRRAPPSRRASSAAAAATRPPARSAMGRLGSLPTQVLGEVVALLDDPEVARARVAAAKGAAHTVEPALASRAARCRNTTRCGDSCASLVRTLEGYRALDRRCTTACWGALKLVLARGIALWDAARGASPSEPTNIYSFALMPTYRRFGAPAREDRAFPEAYSKYSQDTWTFGVACSQQYLYIDVASDLRAADLLDITNDPRVRAAILLTQRAHLAPKGLAGRREANILRQDGAPIDFLWDARYAQGVLDVIEDDTPANLYKCGFAPAVRSAVLDICLERLRPRVGSDAPEADSSIPFKRRRAHEAAARSIRSLITQIRRAANGPAGERVEGLASLREDERLSVLPDAEEGEEKAAAAGGAAHARETKSASEGKRAPALEAAAGADEDIDEDVVEVVKGAEAAEATRGAGAAWARNALFPYFAIGAGNTPLRRRVRLVLAVKLTRDLPDHIRDERLRGLSAVDPQIVAALVPLLHDRELLSRRVILQWLDAGARDFPTNRFERNNIYTGEDELLEAASANAPPSVPFPACTNHHRPGGLTSEEHKLIQAAASSPEASYHYALLPHVPQEHSDKAYAQSAPVVLLENLRKRQLETATAPSASFETVARSTS